MIENPACNGYEYTPEIWAKIQYSTLVSVFPRRFMAPLNFLIIIIYVKHNTPN